MTVSPLTLPRAVGWKLADSVAGKAPPGPEGDTMALTKMDSEVKAAEAL